MIKPVKKPRSAVVSRKTRETSISVSLNLDGSGTAKITTPFPFLTHMLELVARHGLVDLSITARGDIAVDAHHTVEDLGIVLGQAMAKALGKKEGIVRYGHAKVPMDEASAEVFLDISGRPFLVYDVSVPRKSLQGFDPSLMEDFFQGLVTHAGLTLHMASPYGRNTHHILEAVFKAFARALKEAVQRDPRVKGIPSTKGRL